MGLRLTKQGASKKNSPLLTRVYSTIIHVFIVCGPTKAAFWAGLKGIDRSMWGP